MVNAKFFKLEKFLACLHPRIQNKVEDEDPKSYDKVVKVTNVKSQKMKRKLKKGLLKPEYFVPVLTTMHVL